jgi:hypothetical protein
MCRPYDAALLHIAIRFSSSPNNSSAALAIDSASFHSTSVPRPSASSSHAYQYGVDTTALPEPTAYASVPEVICSAFKYGVMYRSAADRNSASSAELTNLLWKITLESTPSLRARLSSMRRYASPWWSLTWGWVTPTTT